MARRLHSIWLVVAVLAGLLAACTTPTSGGGGSAGPSPDITELTDAEVDAQLKKLAPTIQANFADPEIVASIPIEQRAAIGNMVGKLGDRSVRAKLIPELRSAAAEARPLPAEPETFSGGVLSDSIGFSRSTRQAAPLRGSRTQPPPAESVPSPPVAAAGPGACNAPDGEGELAAPVDVKPAQLITPQHDVFTVSSSGIVLNQPGPISVSGVEPIADGGPGIELRRRGPTVQQMRVQINLDDPKDFGPRAVRPLLSIKTIGGDRFDERNVNALVTDAKFHCYKNDAGRPDRGYYDAWVTIPRTEPGFQLVAEVVENDWFFQNVVFDPSLSPGGPQYFAGADRSTVHIGAAPLTRTSSINDAAGAFATTSPDSIIHTPNVLTETNGNSTDDLESAVSILVESEIRKAADSKVGTFLFGYPAPIGVYLSSLSNVNPQVDLEFADPTRFFPPADEPQGSVGALRGHVTMNGIEAGAHLWFMGIPCVGARMSIDAAGRADVWADSKGNETGIDARIDVTVGLNRAEFSLANWYDWLDPTCWLGYLGGATSAYLFAPGAIEGGVEDAFGADDDGPGAVQKLLDGFDLDELLPTVAVAPTFPDQPGLTVGSASMQPRVANLDNAWCTSYLKPTGCTPDQSLIGAQGIEVAGDATIVPSSLPTVGFLLGGRFRNVFRPTLQAKVNDMVTSHRDINHQVAGLGVVLDPAILNLGLRHLVQGPSYGRETNGLLDITGFHIPQAGFTISSRPEVAPQILGVPTPPPVLCPGTCPPSPYPRPPSRTTAATVVPDLRVSLSTGIGAPIEFSIAASVNAGLQFDASTGGLAPVLDTPNVDIQVVGGCQANFTNGYAASYLMCGRGTNGTGGPSSLTALIDWIANTVVLPLVTNSIGQVSLPDLDGILPGVHASITNVRFAQRGGLVAVYADLRPMPKVSIAVSEWTPDQALQFFPTNIINIDPLLPNTEYAWEITDVATGDPVPATVVPGTNESGVRVPLASFVESTDTFGRVKTAHAKLTLTQNALSVTAEATFSWRPPNLPNGCGIPAGAQLLAAPNQPGQPGCP